MDEVAAYRPRQPEDGAVGQIFYGWIGDVRIVNRPLSVAELMTGK